MYTLWEEKNRDLLTRLLSEVRDDVMCYYIDSAEDGPMHRRRYYWTNIPCSSSKHDTRVLKDVLVDTIPIKPIQKGPHKGEWCWLNRKPVDINNKAPTICRANANKSFRIVIDGENYGPGIRTIEKLFGFPDNYTKAVSGRKGSSALGDSWCLYTINRFFKNLK